MRNKALFIYLSLFLFIITISCSFQTTENDIVSDKIKHNINCLTLTPGSDETQINFSWHSHNKSGTIYIREDGSDEELEYNAESVFINDVFGYSHKATVIDLKQNAAYFYRISNGTAKSPEYTITTGDTMEFSFFVMGDPQLTDEKSSVQGWKKTMNKAVTVFPETSFIISCGDQVDNPGSETQYMAYFSPLELKSLPVAQTLGNHDVGNAAYDNHFNLPNANKLNIEYDSVNNQNNYWFTYGKTLFMVLDSNISAVTPHKKFMEQAIDSNPDCVWKIVIFHEGIYSEGAHHNSIYQVLQRNAWAPVFDSLDIDVAFSGHDHTYSRTHPMRGQKINSKGIVYFSLNSSSGSKYYDWYDRQKAFFTAFRSQNQRPQFSKVDVTDHNLTITTYEVMDDGELCMIDSHIIKKSK